MITHTVRADNMIQALESVKREMGPDALVVSVRQVMGGPLWQVWRKPQVEVVAVRLEENESLSKDGQVQAPAKKAKPKPVIKNRSGVVKAYSSANKIEVAEDLESGPAPEPAPETTPSKTTVRNVPVMPEKVVQSPAAQNITEKPDLVEFVTSLKKAAAEAHEAAAVTAQPLPEIRPLAQEEAPVSSQPLPIPPVLAKTYAHLRKQGVDESFLSRLVLACGSVVGSKTMQDEKRAQEYLRKQMEAYIRIQTDITAKTSQATFLVGASGSGKTSVCAKLAANYTRSGILTTWVCADTVRTGAIGEARAYADILGIDFQVAYTPEELVDIVIKAKQGVDLVLVDTPACNPRNENSVVELGALLTALPRRTTWLVASATSKEADLQSTVSAFRPYRPKGLILTKMDETGSFGSAFNLAWRSQLPIAYYTCGSRILDDLVAARAEHLINALFEEQFNL